MEPLDCSGAIVYYENMMAENARLYTGRKLSLNEIVRRDSLQESCLEAIDHLDTIHKANVVG